ncbi:MAG: FeoC-like transcriptional regulator [Tepidimonas sp.]|uniref:FeoC-like transcriptional regulator n=1 Tax=Tepidimonas sp. TaxID=2002775 RepID=UPI00259D833B|nr:FeoC-like transcriptional regulator [Tepidimonas sp.]MDM7456257.1 FeoC-like transcriptional regulator [Tepidimonas sp.]
MILSRLNEYLQQRGRASLQDMAQGLDAAPDALRDMLAILERKGRVRHLQASTACGGCSSGVCSRRAPESLELYEWIDEQTVMSAHNHDCGASERPAA